MGMNWYEVSGYWDATLKVVGNFRKAHSRLADAQNRIAAAQEKRADAATRQADALDRLLAALDLEAKGPPSSS